MMNLNAKAKKIFFGLAIILPLFSTMLLAIRNPGKKIGAQFYNEKNSLGDTNV